MEIYEENNNNKTMKIDILQYKFYSKFNTT